jgi:hypothetical protein
VTVIFGTAPLRKLRLELDVTGNWSAYYISAMFSGSGTPEIPEIRAGRGDESGVSGTLTAPDLALRPTSEPWGLSVCKTLHLVADNQYGYKMF